ncbi:MAG: hypothetical protein GY948_01610 [Alphaproteobacteria bacterium]|nr:hypothetical protein [Alphaproteobacteria bacterium]
MTTHTLNRRDLLGTAAKGLAAFTALSSGTVFATSLAGAAEANVCIANHRQLADNLRVLTLTADVGETEKAIALKTCRCIHCDVAISPML